MNILTALDLDSEIKRLITWVVINVGIDNHLNLTDINIYAENFVIPLLDNILGCNLVNLNSHDGRNYPGIDLGDRVKRIAVQVTSTTARQKVDKTIKKFEDQREYDNFDKLYLIVLNFKKPNYRDFETNGKYEFSQNNIFSINELVNILLAKPENEKQTILAKLQQQLNMPNNKETMLTIEDFLIKKFFEQIMELAKTEVVSENTNQTEALPNNGDLDIKRERFKKYWTYIERCYREVIQLQQEKLFHNAFERLDTSERNCQSPLNKEIGS